MQNRLLLFICLLLLSACNLSSGNLPTPDSDNRIYVTATQALPTADADGVILITATPQLIITATPQIVTQEQPTQQATAVLPPTEQPVATVAIPATAGQATSAVTIEQPNAQLAQANVFLRNGYFTQAMDIYQTILQAGTSIDENIRAEAALRQGQAALREGLFDKALTTLSLMIQEFPQDARTARAYFLRGDAYLGLNAWDAALKDFQQYLNLRPGLVDSYAYERMGDAQLALGQVERAISRYEQAIQAGRLLVPELLLREKIAQLYLGAGVNRIEEAIAQYDAILAVAKNAPYRASIDLLAAQALLNSGNTTEGLPRVRRVFDDYTGTPAAYEAMQILLQNNINLDAYTRGKTYYNAGAYTEAINAFNAFSSSTTLDKITAEFYLLLGRAYREIGNSSAAMTTFQTLIEQFPGDPLFGDALLEQGRTRFLAGNYADAIQTYLGIAETYGYLDETAAEAMWRAGYLYRVELNDANLSRQTFVALADKYPTSEWALNGLLQAASAALESGNQELATSLYQRIAGLTTDEEERSAAFFNLGKLAQAKGDTQTASEAFAQAIQADPGSYYAARSADMRLGRAPFQRPANYQFEFDDVALKQEAEDWLRSTYQITQTGDLAQPDPTLLADPRLIRGQELWALGICEDAIAEFDAITDEARDNNNILRLYQLAVLFQNADMYYSSLIAAADVIRPSGVATVDAPAYLAHMRFPIAYLDVIQDVIGSDNMDPLVMLALIRHESFFDTCARGGAGEKGLTQVMPATAQHIADQIGWENHQHSELFRPYAGIRFGTYYLQEQLGRFSGSVIPSLAAYNAGPGRALAWAELAGNDPDAFMTAIQIDSTRLYVQRIYSYHSIYRSLYAQ